MVVPVTQFHSGPEGEEGIEIQQSEDCLYLNIWTPEVNPKGKKPVFMWIHGGRYANGGGSNMEVDGEAFCREDVVFVNVQFRLGVFGYFAHPQLAQESELGAVGTLGILDLIQALKWLKENIAAFGGDPDNIAVGGQSSGGNMTNALLVSPLSEGLLRRACVHSTGILFDHDPHYSREKAMSIGEAVCGRLGKTIDELRKIPTDEVHEMIMRAAITDGIVEFMPAIDGVVFTEQVYESLAKGNHHDVDILVGGVSGDGIITKFKPTVVERFAALAKEFGGKKADEIVRLFGADDPDQMADAYIKAKKIFPRSQPLSWAMAEQKNGKNPLYIYHFDRHLPGDDKGAYHASELWYVFGTLNRSWRTKKHCFTGWDYMLSQLMTRYWANFIRTGNPNGPDLPRWDPYTEGNTAYMCFDNDGLRQVVIEKDDPSYVLCDIFSDHRLGKF
jgi:para-nitrobenzyl esterase